VPHLQNIASILYEVEDHPEFKKYVEEFQELFPNLYEKTNRVIETPYKFIRTKENNPLSGIETFCIQREYGCDEIHNNTPFEFSQNNRLIDFFVQRNLPVFVGIKSLVRGADQ
jgi:hypothetical protein